MWATAQVLYIFRGFLDIAVLQISCMPIHQSAPDVELVPPQQLMDLQVAVIGYPTFGPYAKMGPSVSVGNVMKVWISDGTVHRIANAATIMSVFREALCWYLYGHL